MNAGHLSVVTYGPGPSSPSSDHDRLTHREAARRLAALHGGGFAGEYDPAAAYRGPLYFVPSETLDTPTAEHLGIRDETDLFGGVVPYAFVATKAITHPLVEPDADAPDGWSRRFSAQVRDIVHTGHSAFTLDDARCAGERLLGEGPVRVKPVTATGGTGQTVVRDAAALADALAALDVAEVATCGVVLEENLSEVVTCSVGRVFTAGIRVSYCGDQRLTKDHDGREVYGGSNLLVVRGRFDALLELPLPDTQRLAVEQARLYDAAVGECYPGTLASRCNYDVAQGRDRHGRWRSGVLEQSWRIGGATPAEIAALAAFRSDPTLTAVRARCIEIYGADEEQPPPDAAVYFRGGRDSDGPRRKCAWVEPYVDAR